MVGRRAASFVSFGLLVCAATAVVFISFNEGHHEELEEMPATRQNLIFNGAPYFTTGVPHDYSKGFPYYDNWVTPWSTYGRHQPSWEPDFNPHRTDFPIWFNPAANKMENPRPYEDGLVAPPDNADPYYAAHEPSLKATLMDLARNARKENTDLELFSSATQQWHQDVRMASREDKKIGTKLQRLMQKL